MSHHTARLVDRWFNSSRLNVGVRSLLIFGVTDRGQLDCFAVDWPSKKFVHHHKKWRKVKKKTPDLCDFGSIKMSNALDWHMFIVSIYFYIFVNS